MVVAIHCKRWNNIFHWSCSQQKSQNHGTITATKNYVARMAVSLWWRSCFVSLVVPLRKVKLNKFLIDHIFEITLHCPNTHLNLKCGKSVNYSTSLTYDTFYMKQWISYAWQASMDLWLVELYPKLWKPLPLNSCQCMDCVTVEEVAVF